MTGFGRASLQLGKQNLRLEMRSVNNRFLDLKLHLPWADGSVEQKVKQTLRDGLARGRVDVSVSADPTSAAAGLALNKAIAQDLAGALDELKDLVGCDHATAARLLPTQRDLLAPALSISDSDALWAAIEPCVKRALEELVAMRAREGKALLADLSAALDALRRLRTEIQSSTASEPARRGEKLKARIDKLCGEVAVDADRLAQEIALLADRCDVSEELVRLESHFAQLDEMLAEDDAVGRKVEFMLQEVNREINTIASKTGDAAVSKLVVEAKGWLEKMREQAQNVE